MVIYFRMIMGSAGHYHNYEYVLDLAYKFQQINIQICQIKMHREICGKFN